MSDTTMGAAHSDGKDKSAKQKNLTINEVSGETVECDEDSFYDSDILNDSNSDTDDDIPRGTIWKDYMAKCEEVSKPDLFQASSETIPAVETSKDASRTDGNVQSDIFVERNTFESNAGVSRDFKCLVETEDVFEEQLDGLIECVCEFEDGVSELNHNSDFRDFDATQNRFSGEFSEPNCDTNTNHNLHSDGSESPSKPECEVPEIHNTEQIDCEVRQSQITRALVSDKIAPVDCEVPQRRMEADHPDDRVDNLDCEHLHNQNIDVLQQSVGLMTDKVAHLDSEVPPQRDQACEVPQTHLKGDQPATFDSSAPPTRVDNHSHPIEQVEPCEEPQSHIKTHLDSEVLQAPLEVDQALQSNSEVHQSHTNPFITNRVDSADHSQEIDVPGLIDQVDHCEVPLSPAPDQHPQLDCQGLIDQVDPCEEPQSHIKAQLDSEVPQAPLGVDQAVQSDSEVHQSHTNGEQPLNVDGVPQVNDLNARHIDGEVAQNHIEADRGLQSHIGADQAVHPSHTNPFITGGVDHLDCADHSHGIDLMTDVDCEAVNFDGDLSQSNTSELMSHGVDHSQNDVLQKGVKVAMDCEIPESHNIDCVGVDFDCQQSHIDVLPSMGDHNMDYVALIPCDQSHNADLMAKPVDVSSQNEATMDMDCESHNVDLAQPVDPVAPSQNIDVSMAVSSHNETTNMNMECESPNLVTQPVDSASQNHDLHKSDVLMEESDPNDDSNSMEADNECINIFLDKCTDKAEARLAARRQARAEAREIRMRELERQQKEQEENADRAYDILAEPLARTPRAASRASAVAMGAGTTATSYLSSRRSSEDSLEDGASIRDVRHELKDMEEKFRKAMIANAQMDNDKSAQTYKLELLKDRLEDMEEDQSQLKRQYREIYREHEQLKRVAVRLKEELAAYKTELEERDRLIAEKGLVIVGEEVSEDEDNASGDTSNVRTPKKALVSAENAELLENAGQGSLDVRLKRFAEEKRELMDQLSHVKLELEEERCRRKRRTSSVASNISITNGPNLESDTIDIIDVQREANKQLADYKFRLQKSDQDIATLQATVARLESQVIRYKSAAEASEKAEDELKVEKRKLQREARESQNRVEELETANNHLQRRLDKLKNAKSALLKEL